MTTLTCESLQEAIRNFVESPEDKISLRPTKLLIQGGNMTTLTCESLEAAIRNISNFMGPAEDTISVRPTKLLISAEMNRYLRRLPPMAKLRGPQGRARALKRRGVSLLKKMFK